MGLDICGFEIVSSKQYLVSKYVKNGKHNKIECCRRVTIIKFKRDRQTHTHTQTGRQRDRYREAERERETDRQTEMRQREFLRESVAA